MKVLFKLAIRNIMRKKLKFFLLFLTFVLSSLTIMTAVFFKDAAVLSRERQLRDNTLNSQLLISSTDEGDRYFDPRELLTKLDTLAGISGIVTRCNGMAQLEGSGTDKKTAIVLIGTDYEQQSKVYSFELKSKADILPFQKKAIICESFAAKHGLSLGDTLNVDYKGKKQSYKIAAIALKKGVFQSENVAIIPIAEAQELLGQQGKIMTIGITLSELDKIEEVKEGIKPLLSGKLTVEQRYDMDFFKASVGTISMAVSIFAAFAIFITLFLTYSTFKTMLYERIAQIGILRSIGATKRQLFRSIYIENLIITGISALAGILVSIPFIKAVAGLLVKGDIDLSLDYRKISLIFLSLLAVGLLSIIASVIRVMGIPIVSIIKGNVSRYKAGSRRAKSVAGLLLLVLSITLLAVFSETPEGLWYLVGGLCLLVIGFVLLTELIHRLLNATLFRSLNLLGAEARLIWRDFGRDFAKSAESLILIILVTAIAYLSFTISYLVKESADRVYQGMDISLTSFDTQRELTAELYGIDGVGRVIQQLRAERKVRGQVVEISGIDPDKYRSISFELAKDGDKTAIFDSLKEDRSIIVTTSFIKNTGCRLGDYVGIKTAQGYEKYKITGIVSSFENMGKVLFISKDNFKRDIGSGSYDRYLISLKPGQKLDTTVKAIEEKLKDRDCSIMTMEEMRQGNAESNDKLFLIINTLFLISILVSIISLNNNLIINILTRARVYAIERTVGMSRRQLGRVLLGEGIILGLEGAALGIILGYTMNIYLIKILAYFIGDLASASKPGIMAVLIAASGLAGLLSGIYPYRRLCRLELVQSIKGIE